MTHFRTLLNLVNWNAANVFHIVAEVLPELLVSSQVLRLHDGIPVAFRVSQQKGVLSSWLDLVNWELRKLNVHFMEDDHLFFAEKLVAPAHSFCAHPSASVLQVRLAGLPTPLGWPTDRVGRPHAAVVHHMTSTYECRIACMAPLVHRFIP